MQPEHHNDLCLIAAHDIGEDALEHLAGVFDLGAGAIAAPAGADLYDFRLLCHYASPPFSSKSPGAFGLAVVDILVDGICFQQVGRGCQSR